jgi:hypothetical protein
MMAIDIREIELTDEQRRRIAALAEETGRPWRELLDEQLAGPTEAVRTMPSSPHKDRYIEDYDKWKAYFHEWLSKQTSHNPNFDDSRESIYP